MKNDNWTKNHRFGLSFGLFKPQRCIKKIAKSFLSLFLHSVDASRFCIITRKIITDEMVAEKEKYKEIGDGLDNAFEELYGV